MCVYVISFSRARRDYVKSKSSLKGVASLNLLNPKQKNASTLNMIRCLSFRGEIRESIHTRANTNESSHITTDDDDDDVTQRRRIIISVIIVVIELQKRRARLEVFFFFKSFE